MKLKLMITVVVCLVFALSASAVQLPNNTVAGTLPTVKIECGVNAEIYKNRSRADRDVTVQATDNCEDLSSDLVVKNRAGDVVGDPELVKTGQTRTMTFTVAVGGTIHFDCSGNSGGCSYTISL